MASAGMTPTQRLAPCRVDVLAVSQHESGPKNVLGLDITSVVGVTKPHLTNNSATLHHFTDCVGVFHRFKQL